MTHRPAATPLALASLLLALAPGAALAADPVTVKKPSPPVVAAPAPTPFFDATFGFRGVTDYNFRGVSQSNRMGSVNGNLEVTAFEGLLYGGIYGYRVDLPTKPTAEIDLTAGIRPKITDTRFGDFTFDLGVVGYVYPGERRFQDINAGLIFTPKNTDYTEVAGRFLWAPTKELTFGANVFRGWNYLGTGANNTYVSGTAKYALPEGLIPVGTLAFSGELGRHIYSGRTSASLGAIKLPDYTYGNAGVAYTYKAVTLDLRYHDSSLNKRDCFTLTADPKGVLVSGISGGAGVSNWCGSAVVATLSVDFTLSELLK